MLGNGYLLAHDNATFWAPPRHLPGSATRPTVSTATPNDILRRSKLFHVMPHDFSMSQAPNMPERGFRMMLMRTV